MLSSSKITSNCSRAFFSSSKRFVSFVFSLSHACQQNLNAFCCSWTRPCNCLSSGSYDFKQFACKPFQITSFFNILLIDFEHHASEKSISCKSNSSGFTLYNCSSAIFLCSSTSFLSIDNSSLTVSLTDFNLDKLQKKTKLN